MPAFGLTPPTVPSCQLWLESDHSFQDVGATTPATTTAQKVAAITDQSGNALNFTQATVGSQPTYQQNIFGSIPSVRFDGAAFQLGGGNPALLATLKDSSYTAFFVFSAATIPTVGTLLSKTAQAASGTASVWFALVAAATANGNTNSFMRYADCLSSVNNKQQGAIVAATPYLVTYRFTLLQRETVANGSFTFPIGLEEVFINGRRACSHVRVLPGWEASANWRIGSTDVPGNFFNGDLGAILLYNRSLTENEREQVESYLTAKYGVRAERSLPQRFRDNFEAKANVLVMGNGIAAGFGSFGQGWDVQMRPNLRFPMRVINYGTAALTTTALNSIAPSKDFTFLQAEPLNVVVLWEIAEDLAANVVAATAFNNVKTLAAAAKAAGAQYVLIATPLPRGTGFSGGQTSGGYETARQSVLASLRADFNVLQAGATGANASVFGPANTSVTYADLLIDVAADATMGPAGSNLSATYYTDPYPTAAGHAMLAPYFTAGIGRVLGQDAEVAGWSVCRTKDNVSYEDVLERLMSYVGSGACNRNADGSYTYNDAQGNPKLKFTYVGAPGERTVQVLR